MIAAPENPRASPTSPDVPPHPTAGGGTDTSRPDAPDVCVILDDVRSLYNVGAVMRACDGAGIFTVHACGITPFPPAGLDLRDDPRRGPVAARAARELRKVALSAYDTVRVTHWPDASEAIAHVRAYGATVVAVETSPDAVRYRGASANSSAFPAGLSWASRPSPPSPQTRQSAPLPATDPSAGALPQDAHDHQPTELPVPGSALQLPMPPGCLAPEHNRRPSRRVRSASQTIPLIPQPESDPGKSHSWGKSRESVRKCRTADTSPTDAA